MFDKNRFKASVICVGYTLEDVSKELGINIATLHRKMNGDSDFTRKEVHKIMDILNLSFDDMAKIFFANKLTKTQENNKAS